MLAVNMLLFTLIIVGAIGTAIWWVFIRPLTKKVVTVCDKIDHEKEESERLRAQAEKELEDEFGHKIGEEPPEQHINQH